MGILKKGYIHAINLKIFTDRWQIDKSCSGQVNDESRIESVRRAHTSGNIRIKLSVPIWSATAVLPYKKNVSFQGEQNYRYMF